MEVRVLSAASLGTAPEGLVASGEAVLHEILQAQELRLIERRPLRADPGRPRRRTGEPMRPGQGRGRIAACVRRSAPREPVSSPRRRPERPRLNELSGSGSPFGVAASPRSRRSLAMTPPAAAAGAAQEGLEGPRVASVQKAARARHVDRIYGPATRRAVKALPAPARPDRGRHRRSRDVGAHQAVRGRQRRRGVERLRRGGGGVGQLQRELGITADGVFGPADRRPP